MKIVALKVHHPSFIDEYCLCQKKFLDSVQDFFEWLKNCNEIISITKEGRRLGSPLCLKLGSFSGDGE